MRRFISSFACIPFAIAAFISAPASAAIVVEVSGFAPGGDVVDLAGGNYDLRVNLWFNDPTDDPANWTALPNNVNSMALDLSWMTSGGITVNTVSPMIAGPLAGVSGTLINSIPDFAATDNGQDLPILFPGDPIADSRVGGGGFTDRGLTGAPTNFGGALASGATNPQLLMSADINITADGSTPGSSISFGVQGLLATDAGGTEKLIDGAGNVFSAASFNGSLDAIVDGGISLADAGGLNGSSLSFVPEPGSAAGLLALVGLVSLRSRRRSS